MTEDYEKAILSAMDDTDPYLVSEALKIIKSNMKIAQKTEAIWTLFQERKKKQDSFSSLKPVNENVANVDVSGRTSQENKTSSG